VQATPPSLTEIFSHSLRAGDVHKYEQPLKSREVRIRRGRSFFIVRN
jgi:hypothetical protein